MQNEQSGSGREQIIMIAVLLIMSAVCGLLLYRSNRPVPVHHAASPAVSVATEPAAGTEAQTSSAPRTTTAAAVTEPDDRSVCLAYLSDELIPACGLADDSAPGACSAQNGIAGAYFADFRGCGTDDMLVIRLETLDPGHAAAPVFEWYAVQDGTVTLLDSFSCKMPWSDIAVRYSDRTLYVSGCDIPLNENAENRKYAELTVRMQDGDMQTAGLEQDYGNADRPAAPYPENAALLLTVEPDRTQTPAAEADRRYLLTDYTGLRESLPKKSLNQT